MQVSLVSLLTLALTVSAVHAAEPRRAMAGSIRSPHHPGDRVFKRDHHDLAGRSQKALGKAKRSPTPEVEVALTERDADEEDLAKREPKKSSGRHTASVHSGSFAALSSIPVHAIYQAAMKIVKNGSGTVRKYPIGVGNTQAGIHDNWLKKAGAYFWLADMDVDCDGADFRCPGNPDGLPETTFGRLSAYNVPFIVMPDNFYMQNQRNIPDNAMAAVICDGKMFYGILGDTNGDSPQVIGEASWLMAQSCFPNDGLNGNKGHSERDVLYIQFTGDDAEVDGIGETVKDMGDLKNQGDKLMKRLVNAINL